MTSSREEDERVMEILAATRRKPAAERDAYLRSACAGDEDLRREVADALSWDERMGGFLEQPVAIIADGNPGSDSPVTAAAQFPAGLELGQFHQRDRSNIGNFAYAANSMLTRAEPAGVCLRQVAVQPPIPKCDCRQWRSYCWSVSA
jgi:hypothetical protein